MKEGWIMMYEARRLYDVLGIGFFFGTECDKKGTDARFVCCVALAQEKKWDVTWKLR